MIVLAESNFVLELAFQQEQSEDAQRVVDLAAAGQVELVIPACSFAEPYQTLIRRQRERKALNKNLQHELKQLSRSKAFAGRVSASRDLAETLAAGDDLESAGLEQTVAMLTKLCTVSPLTRQIIRDAQDVQREFNLDPHDALVFASIQIMLKERDGIAKVFITKNSKDFATLQIEEHLERYRCKLFTNFATARRFLGQAIAQPL